MFHDNENVSSFNNILNWSGDKSIKLLHAKNKTIYSVMEKRSVSPEFLYWIVSNKYAGLQVFKAIIIMAFC